MNLAGASARPQARRRLTTSAVAAGLVLALLALTWSMPPVYNWDMLAYSALALDESDATSRHQTLWRYVQRDVPPAQIALLRGQMPPGSTGARLADTIAYRRITASDPLAFAEQLPFYSVKPLYPALIAGGLWSVDGAVAPDAKGLGIGPVELSIVIAKLSWVGLGVALFLFLRLQLSNGFAALGTVVLMCVPMVHSLSGYSTPDALSASLIVLGLVLALRDPSRQWTIASASVILLGVAARPDTLLLLGLLLTWFLWNARIRFRWAVGVGVVGASWCLGISEITNNYGWRVLVHHSFYDFAEYPSRLQPQFGLVDLLELYRSKIATSLVFFQVAGLGTALAGVRWYRRGGDDRLFQAIVIVLLFMAAHWLMFPDQKDRQLIGPYLLILSSGLFVLLDHLSDTATDNYTGTRPDAPPDVQEA